MTDPTPTPAGDTTQPAAVPDSIPWYRSKILVGVLTAIAAQVLSRVQAKYHVDASVYGINANDLATWALDAISALGAGLAVHGRATQKAAPAITLTKPPAPPTA